MTVERSEARAWLGLKPCGNPAGELSGRLKSLKATSSLFQPGPGSSYSTPAGPVSNSRDSVKPTGGPQNQLLPGGSVRNTIFIQTSQSLPALRQAKDRILLQVKLSGHRSRGSPCTHSRAQLAAWGMNGCMTGKEQRNREGREIYSLIKDSVRSENIPGSAEGRCQLTVLEPPPWSWPGGHVVSEPSLAAGGDTAGGECLWAGWPQAPGGHVPPEMDWFTHLSPQSCFNERPKGLSAPGLCVGTKEGS